MDQNEAESEMKGTQMRTPAPVRVSAFSAYLDRLEPRELLMMGIQSLCNDQGQ